MKHINKTNICFTALLLVGLAVVSGCNEPAGAKNEKEFEGVIT